MNYPKTKLDKRVRIELLRARATIEREEMGYLVCQLSTELKPANIWSLLKGQLMTGVGANFGAGSKTQDWLSFLLSFGKRYPLVVSGASVLAGSIVRKKKWRLGAMALTAWRLFGVYQGLHQSKQDKYVHADKPQSSRVMGPF